MYIFDLAPGSAFCMVHIEGACSVLLMQAMGKVYWEGVAWVEPVIMLKILALAHSHIKRVLKVYRANIP